MIDPLRHLPAYDPRGLWLACARSMFAAATLSIIVCNPDDVLFLRVGDQSAVRCGGVQGLSLWCLGQVGDGDLSLARIVSVLVLGLVVVGFRPRWTCIPHWYVTYSLCVSMTLPNGGEHVAQIATMLLIPLCLGDHRTWQWQSPVTALHASWRGASLAAMYVFRVQVCIIYAHAAWSKLMEQSWRDGTAEYVIFFDPHYGPYPPVREALLPVLSSPSVIVGLTWSTIGMEIAIAVLALGTRRMRLAALGLAVLLHGGIIALMGMPSFGLIMIALLTTNAVAGANQAGPAPTHSKGSPVDRDNVAVHPG
ncbi:sporulation-delaying protein SdpB family protein [Actinoplanes teichomyceticus]|uniref:Antimicrobial peptide system SdpB family protein n=1 Tax=Actinoplanes teichomyceticus TaxID=1867 RepID=A0A561WR36_ACTTI|nr:sporulation-delaying protein SdpB family protein [Actinoplanes teichomyceticus]TWG26299.1 antimicrobial peptide system SdpB family protein [Actinoplanes teichomyceticus]GIF11378.1 sporulation-delaying protein SdpB [Actinoplanes teichomyceticus]